MYRSWIVAVVLLASPAFADHDRGPERELPPNAIALDGEKLRDRLDQLADLLDRAAWEKNPKRRHKMLTEAREELNEVRRMAQRAPEVRERRPEPPPVVQRPPFPPGTPNSPPPPPVVNRPGPGGGRVMPITEAAYRDLRRAIERESFGHERLRVLETAAPSKWFLVSQVKDLLTTLDFPRERLRAIRILKPRMLDAENFYQLYDSFTFSTDKAELKKILEG